MRNFMYSSSTATNIPASDKERKQLYGKADKNKQFELSFANKIYY